ncbi:MAG: hypothetical protein J5833_02900, partial [Victivallales bacterium]|nr:hypothetical protein [Victivallales bacterium]
MALCVAAIAAPGERLVAEWDFSKRTDADLAGKFTGGFCRGTAAIKDGWLGDESKYSDTASGYQVGNKIYPELTPSEGFRIEAICRLNETPNGHSSMFFDNKYLFYNPGDATHHGFAFGFNRGKDAPDRLNIIAYLGFADHSSHLSAPDITVNPAEEHVFAMEYNGNGRISFIVDGKCVSQHHVKGKGLAPAIRPAVIGDRCGSTHDWLDGKLRNLKLYAFAPQVLEVKYAGRKAFRRGEKDASLPIKVANGGAEEISDLKVEYRLRDGEWTPLKTTADRIAAESAVEAAIPVETALGVGEYPLEIRATAKSGSGAIADTLQMNLRLGPALPPEEYPVLMWGGWKVMDVMKDSGFTHDLGGFSAEVYGSKDLEATANHINNVLDNYVANGFRRADYFTLAHHGGLMKQFPRRSREGVLNEKNIEASNPEYQALVTDVAAKTAQIIAAHPACDALLINSEVRDSTSPSFGKYEPAAFEKFAGYPIP